MKLNQVYIKVLLSTCLGLMAGTALANNSLELKHKSAGMTCTSCHKVPGDRVESKACLQCHDQNQVAKKTEFLNFEAKLKNPKTGKEEDHIALVNPHDSYHFGKSESCLDCHREHSPSTNECQTCHDIKAWKMGTPR